jgi:alkyl sulfatase BDS1-like metallo-beta-lactamase superfamily hydrolase
MTTSQNKAAASKKSTTKSVPAANKELETEMPLSEKDEVKKAEQRINKNTKKS